MAPPPEPRSIFYGRKIKGRLTTRWGTHSLVAAARLLLQEALRDPRNQRFLLLSGEGPALVAGQVHMHLQVPACLQACPGQWPACWARGWRLSDVRSPAACSSPPVLSRDEPATASHLPPAAAAESDVPLWPPGLLYLQMMAEPRSSVRACSPATEQEVLDSQPKTARLLGIPLPAWRKSSQW